jgi:transposase, IS6 family
MTRYRIDIDAARRRLAAREHVTDHARVYPGVLEKLASAAWRRTDRHANRVEADHGRLKVRLRPMRGFKRDRSARIAG